MNSQKNDYEDYYDYLDEPLKNFVKLKKKEKQTSVLRPRYYYPGRNFVHQKSKSVVSKNINKNDDYLIPLDFYSHQIKSKFIKNDDLEIPHFINGELYCDCGFYLNLKNEKINNLTSKLQKASKEKKKMKQKLIEMSIKENQLQLVCRSQSKANIRYFNNQINGKPSFIALSNATSQSNPVELF